MAFVYMKETIHPYGMYTIPKKTHQRSMDTITYYVPEIQQLERLSSVNSDKPHTLSGIIPVDGSGGGW